MATAMQQVDSTGRITLDREHAGSTMLVMGGLDEARQGKPADAPDLAAAATLAAKIKG